MKLDLSEEFTLRVRALQAIHATAHKALRNWGLWSRDRRGIFPTITRPSMWDEFDASKVPDWGEAHEIPAERLAQTDAKAERSDTEPYDEKAGTLLDERIHAHGGLPVHLREVLRIAYVTREVPESQFPRACGCPPHAFAERLEACLVFVSRFS